MKSNEEIEPEDNPDNEDDDEKNQFAKEYGDDGKFSIPID